MPRIYWEAEIPGTNSTATGYLDVIEQLEDRDPKDVAEQMLHDKELSVVFADWTKL